MTTELKEILWMDEDLHSGFTGNHHCLDDFTKLELNCFYSSLLFCLINLELDLNPDQTQLTRFHTELTNKSLRQSKLKLIWTQKKKKIHKCFPFRNFLRTTSSVAAFWTDSPGLSLYIFSVLVFLLAPVFLQSLLFLSVLSVFENVSFFYLGCFPVLFFKNVPSFLSDVFLFCRLNCFPLFCCQRARLHFINNSGSLAHVTRLQLQAEQKRDDKIIWWIHLQPACALVEDQMDQNPARTLMSTDILTSRKGTKRSDDAASFGTGAHTCPLMLPSCGQTQVSWQQKLSTEPGRSSEGSDL